ncbi:MAG: O-antigen ligase [Dokdonia sp.]
MNIIIILFCFFLAGFFHQGLYIIIPFISIYYISNQKESRLTLNPISKIYLYAVLVVLGFFLVQSILYFDIKIFSIKGWLRFISYFLFAVLISYMKQKDIKYFFVIIAIYFVLTLPVGVYQFLERGRYRNIWDHSNHLAYVLSMSIYFLIFYKPFKNKKVNLVCLIGLALSLILTTSTGGLLVLLALLGYNAIKSKRISFVKKLTFLILLIIVIIFAINFSEKIAYQLDSVNFLTWRFVEERIENYTIDGVNRAGGYGSFVWRIIFWSKLMLTFFSESFLQITFGVGVDHLTKGYMPYEFMDKDPHNDFIKVLLEYGALGLLFFLSFFSKVYKVLHKNFNIIILMVVPMFFGNAIVNYPFNLTLILILMYEYKKNYNKSN